MTTRTDRELLAAWRETGDESAFAELVARHRQMVYRTSLRMLGSVQDTEDAVQAVFVVLAQKADRLQREGSLGGWLHTVTRHVAMQALARRASHARREKEFAMWPEADIETSSPNVDTSAVLRCLDQELAGLSAVLREAVVLRYLQGNSEKAAAELAGCPLGTLSWRASKGLAKLRARLAKRGVALGGVALAGLLASEASAAVPETLLPSILATVKTAVATTATATTATSTAAMLAKGAMKAMFIAKVKMVAVIAAAVIVTGTAVPVGIAVAQAVGREGDASSATSVPAAAQARTGTVQTADATNSAPWEVTLSAEDYKKLNVEEGVLLGKADKAFADKEYGQATSLYDSFTTQFPKSAAVVYAMVRKARSLQYDNRRFEALRTYVEVMDYYPDRIPYAAAALYYIGECHYANGATNEALKAWAEMTKDADYRKHVATGVINHLADNLVALGKWPAAVVYYEQIHTDLRPGNLQEANYARSRLLYYYTRVRSNVDQALALANELIKVPKYAKDTYLIRAGLYRSKKMYKEAINDYKMADQPPGTYYAIAECYMECGKPSQAIQQLTEIESFFVSEAPEAALRIAYVYRTTKQQDKYVAALRGVLKKYSGPHSSTAHQLLQAMGNKPGGAEEVK